MSAPVLSERTEKALRDIGLTEYESQAYLSLLTSGEETAENISQLSNIPYTKVYSVLESLEARGWVEHGSGRPRNIIQDPQQMHFAPRRSRWSPDLRKTRV